MRGLSRIEEPFILNGIASLIVATVWLFWRHDLLLQYFYFDQLLALTHLVTLGFLSSVMMGVLHRFVPTFLHVEPASLRVSRFQFIFYAIGSWGMITHFWMGGSKGVSWSTFLVCLASVLQLWNFRALFRPSRARGGRKIWVGRFVASALVFFVLAASMGILLGLLKAYEVRTPGLATQFIDNVFAHAHLAAIGWVLTMILGIQLQLVPSTFGDRFSLPIRFTLLWVGTLGVAFAFLTGRSVAPFAVMLAILCGWHMWGPLRSFCIGRTREWELLPLTLLVTAAGLGVALAFGWPSPSDPLRGRVQLAYGFLGIFGFMVLSVVTLAFKLFPMWVWKERFQKEFGRRPVPAMKELHSERLRIAANVTLFTGVLTTAIGIYQGNETVLAVSTTLILAGIACFLINFVRVARWDLLKKNYEPTEADWVKFKKMFPEASSAGSPPGDLRPR